jgi:MSHA biogenesis protein MshP
MKCPQRNQQGFAIVAALFLLVIVGTLAAMAVRTGTQQQHAADLEVLSSRAWAAAQSGLGYGLASANAGNCNYDRSYSFPASAPSLAGFSVRVRCAASQHLVSGISYSVFDVSATASRGTYGNPGFVRRELTRRFSTLP